MSRQHRQLDRRRWSLVRRAVFSRDNYRCTLCGRAGALEAHHVQPLHGGGDEYGLGNLRTLCKACHVRAHRRPLTEAEAAWRALLDELVG